MLRGTQAGTARSTARATQPRPFSQSPDWTGPYEGRWLQRANSPPSAVRERTTRPQTRRRCEGLPHQGGSEPRQEHASPCAVGPASHLQNRYRNTETIHWRKRICNVKTNLRAKTK